MRGSNRFSSRWITEEKLASFCAPATADCHPKKRSVSLRGSAALVSLQLA
jgi:hypothetical protein